MPIEVVNLAERLSRIGELWSPKIVGEVNGLHVKLARLEGEFVWHAHEAEDELFLVVAGRLRMRFRDRELVAGPGEFLIVPRGVEHCPVAEGEVHVLLVEPASTVNTGTAGGARTREAEWL
jgi:mannose-6-phosphate isomerase-like protein (cupin superfamily)